MTKKILLKALIIECLFLTFLIGTPKLVYAASLQLIPPGGTHAVNDTFDVKINLSLSGEKTDGADAKLNFDKDILEVASITPSSLFATYPTKSYDNNNGIIKVSGIAQINSPVTASGVMATVTFKAKNSGSTSVTFDFTSGKTTDSNVAENGTGTDILQSVINGSYTISGSSSSDSSSGVGGDSGTTTTDTSTGLPVTGNQSQTITLFFGALAILGLGIGWRFFRA